MKRCIACLIIALSLLAGNSSYGQSALVAKVLAQLQIESNQCNEELIAEKPLPYHKELSVVVIPKYNEKEEEFFSLDSYILVVNNQSGKIISKYFEEGTTNGWTSDAVRLESIFIDTAPYKVKAGVNAFAIKLAFRGSSNPNPYSSELISIFEPRGAKIKCLLKNFDSETSTGEWDMHCAGEFNEEVKTLSFSKTVSQGYYNIIVKNKIRHIVSTKVNDDCKKKITSKTTTKILRFKNGMYQ
ncbi:hypothetical protein VRU48_00870 [Pedobacter sp. KR3-3]|uniref:Secreted protein n=1 Tax=Pedobacter albus TaxID=3113905 RepID=A0ABU7I2E3_9SPHI|nr:hypothetical protein [Pedobacter sp. KR3-3]MEE1943637.1 hypothetical protein [Pedobacter sp. KR3-3]